MNKTILYLHSQGFMYEDSMMSYLRQIEGCNVMKLRLDLSPHEDLSSIRQLCAASNPDLIVGVGLGALYAIKMYDYRRICINPGSWYVPKNFRNAMTIDDLERNLFKGITDESRRKCWVCFVDELPINLYKNSFMAQLFPNVNIIPRNGRDDDAIVRDVMMPLMNMILGEEWTDEWGVTYSSFGRILKEVTTQLSCDEYTIPEGVEEMVGTFWQKGSNLKKIHLPSTLRKMEANTFIHCGIEELEIPEGVEEIPDFMCEGCRDLRKVILPSTIKEIHSGAFNCCHNLESINIPDSLEDIDEGAFRLCTSLKSIVFPPKINFICPGLFYCSGIETIEIHENITYLGHNVFWGCKNLKRLVIPKTMQQVGAGLVTAHDGFEGVVSHAERYKVVNDALIDMVIGELLCCWTQQKHYVVPEEVMRIADFSGNKYVETITVKQHVELTYRETFASNINLRKVDFQGGVIGVDEQTFYNCPKYSE